MQVMKRISAAKPRALAGKQYHIDCKPGDVGRYVCLPGDPDRVPKIAQAWKEAREVSSHREYRIWTGNLDGVKVSACSTGIGCPATAIAVEELARIGSDTLLRVGSCGAIQRGIECGDLIIATGGVRLEGTSKHYAPSEYPAVGSFELTLALIEACETLGLRYHVGLLASSDSFYVGQGRPGFRDYFPSWAEKLVPDLQKARVLGFEMETSALYVIAHIYGLRAGSVCAVYADRVKDRFVAGAGEQDCIRAANEAVRILSTWDRESEKAGKEFFYPGLLKMNR